MHERRYTRGVYCWHYYFNNSVKPFLQQRQIKGTPINIRYGVHHPFN